MSSRYIAVVDVGKTHKKVLVFDESLNIVDSAGKVFEERVEGIIHLEELDGMTRWMIRQLGSFAASYPIRALSITTHGATAFCLDKNGALAVPPVAYTTEADRQFSDEFFNTFGSREYLQEKTATAEVGALVNVGKKIFFIKKTYPDRFKEIDSILFFPQYLGFLLTGKKGAEPTTVGCHTYLFDFHAGGYSEVARKLGIIDKLPAHIGRSWDVLGTPGSSIAAQTGLARDCIVTMGIHDSNASFLPYLVQGYENFVLNSTGTWCVMMHPAHEVSFEKDELGKMVFYNLDPFFNPVKTSIVMAGQEFETYSKILKTINRRDDYPPFDGSIYEKVIRENRLFILPSVIRGAGLFPDSEPRVIEDGMVYALGDIQSGRRIPPFFNNHETAHAALNISLAIQTSTAIGMAGFPGSGEIFVEGGFRKNSPYNQVLSALFPRARVSCTTLNEATAFGAALLASAALNKKSPLEMKDSFAINTIPVEGQSLPGIEEYRGRFLELVRNRRGIRFN